MPIQFSKSEMIKAMRLIRNQVKEEGKQPKQIYMIDKTGKTRTLKHDEYCGLFDNQASYFHKYWKLPNYTSLLYECKTPFRGNPQPNSWTCGSTSLANASTQILDYKTELECRKACQTNTNGTIPQNLITGGAKLGIKVNKLTRTFNKVKSAISHGYGVIAHIQTGGTTKPKCLGYINNYGHYINIYDTTEDYKFKVYDPTKGYKLCNAQTIIKATDGRDINFYVVKPTK